VSLTLPSVRHVSLHKDVLIFRQFQDRFAIPTLARKALGSNSLLAGFPTGASFAPNERTSHYCGSNAEMK
jgi:hypothetical protein